MKVVTNCNFSRHARTKTGRSVSHGFTLVEIMIVVAVIALLAMIAIPNFLKARNSARVKACISNLRMLNTAKAQWAFETKQVSTATPVNTDVTPYLRFEQWPECPANGSYRLRRLSRTPTCTLFNDGHTLANLNFDDDAAPD
jgi:prepilin-type N-terminal cleavage/methylation domain-containing protein